MASIDIGKINDVIHGRLRLGVMTYLVNAEAASFTELKEALGVTQGNLSVQLRKLQDAGYIEIDKRFEKQKPLTTVRLTPEGRKAFTAYLEMLTQIVENAKG